MTIECEYCNEEIWCLRYNDEWVCKTCFMEECGGSYGEWQDLNDEAKRRRQEKRARQFDEDHINI